MDFTQFPIVDVEAPPPAKSRKRRREIVSQLCPNCDERFTPSVPNSVYCSIQCRDEAKAVRYGRARHRQYGKLLPVDVAEALRIKIAHALGGGYDQAARRLSAAQRAEVRQRDEGRCVQCRAPGEEIDHIDGPSPELTNLRLLCKACHQQITITHLEPITDRRMRLRAAGLRRRVQSVDPLRPCDMTSWNWQEWVAKHRRYVNAS